MWFTPGDRPKCGDMLEGFDTGLPACKPPLGIHIPLNRMFTPPSECSKQGRAGLRGPCGVQACLSVSCSILRSSAHVRVSHVCTMPLKPLTLTYKGPALSHSELETSEAQCACVEFTHARDRGVRAGLPHKVMQILVAPLDPQWIEQGVWDFPWVETPQHTHHTCTPFRGEESSSLAFAKHRLRSRKTGILVPYFNALQKSLMQLGNASHCILL